jgi:hypothetical protein
MIGPLQFLCSVDGIKSSHYILVFFSVVFGYLDIGLALVTVAIVLVIFRMGFHPVAKLFGDYMTTSGIGSKVLDPDLLVVVGY